MTEAANDRREENAQRRGQNEAVVDEFRANGGKVGGFFENTPLLLLHHVGAKSGAAYVTPLAFQHYGDEYVIVAANGGRAHNPAWVYNLDASAETSIELGSATVQVKVRRIEGDEWEALADVSRRESQLFSRFEAATTRRIPFFALAPVHDGGAGAPAGADAAAS